MPVKPPHSSPTDSTGVVIPNTGTPIEYDAVVLELVPLAHRNPATDTMVEHRSLPPSPLGQVGKAKEDRAARVAKGEAGTSVRLLPLCGPSMVSFFPRPPRPSLLHVFCVSRDRLTWVLPM
jgi:hypothetical protein